MHSAFKKLTISYRYKYKKMIQEYQIRVLPVVASSEQNIRQFVAEDKGIDARTINAVRVLKRSIDARQRTISLILR